MRLSLFQLCPCFICRAIEVLTVNGEARGVVMAPA